MMFQVFVIRSVRLYFYESYCLQGGGNGAPLAMLVLNVLNGGLLILIGVSL